MTGEIDPKQALLALKEELLSGQEAYAELDSPEKTLERKLDAMWVLMKEKLNLTDSDLSATTQLLRDRAVEALEKAKEAEALEPEDCPKCGRPMSVKTQRCFYCGGDEETVKDALKMFGGADVLE